MSDRSGAPAIWVSDSDGSHPRLLLTDEFAGSPQWSPDGTNIAYDTRTLGIGVIGLDGGKQRMLTEGPASAARPAWSSDGRWIYFRSDRSGAMQIWRIAAEGGTPTQITRDGAWEAIEDLDGKLLYFVRDRSSAGLWSIPVEGGDAQLVTAKARIGWLIFGSASGL